MNPKKVEEEPELAKHKKTASKTEAVHRLKTRKTKEAMEETTFRLSRRTAFRSVPRFIK